MSENTLPEAPGSDDAPAEKRARKRVTKPQTAEAGAPAPEAAALRPSPSPEGMENARAIGMLVYDKNDRPVILVNNEWALNWILQRNQGLEFLTVPPDKARV